MPKATDPTGKLQPINCIINVPGVGALRPRILPDITDTKSATYSDEPIIGRSFPIKTYSHSNNRTITMKWHIVIVDDDTLNEAITQLKAFQSCVYPNPGSGQTPYAPPSICTMSCGVGLSAGVANNTALGLGAGVGSTLLRNPATPLCVILMSYTMSYPTDVAWDETNLLPYKFDIDLNWDVVYATSQLPGADKIIR